MREYRKFFKPGHQQRDIGHVYVQNADGLEKAIRRLNKQLSNAKVGKTLKLRKAHPTSKARRKAALLKRRSNEK